MPQSVDASTPVPNLPDIENLRPHSEDFGRWREHQIPDSTLITLNGDSESKKTRPEEMDLGSRGGSAASLETTGEVRVVGETRYGGGSELGRGGMGVVYLVRDLELKRSVALKTLQSSDNEQLRRRFLREARITAQLSHPNITPIYSYGILLDGRPTISMPIVGRNTLAFELEGRSRAEISRTLHYYLDVFLKVCDAVAYAHHRGIIHRDIKPENVLIGAYGGVQLVDWGLAYVKKDPASEDLDLRHDSRDTQMSAHIDPGMTVVGTIIGTPSFMPPEQALGKTHELDERSDIFALGGILHCILTGTPPNTGSSLTDCLRAAIAGIRPPSHSLAPSNVPRSLTEICDKALLKKPEARYQSVAEMVAAILSARLNHHRGTKARTAVGIVVGSVSLTIATFGLCLSLFEYLDIAWTYWAAFICASFGVAAGSLLEAIYSPVLSVEVGKKTSKTHAIGRAG